VNCWDFTVGETLAVAVAAAPDGHCGVVGAMADEITVLSELSSRRWCR
jgi:hypothetical protein